MSHDKSLEKYIKKFQNLRYDPNIKRYTMGKSPHKPILLLSLIILDKNEKIDLMNIKPNIYLRDTWSELWKLLEYKKIGPIYLPLYHLKNDGFWNIKLRKGVTTVQPKSLNKFNNMVDSISLNTDLINLIKQEKSRSQLINTLLNAGYFSDNEIRNLRKKFKMLDNSFEYEEKINSLINEDFITDIKLIVKEEPSRKVAFRRIILNAYDETCSICGIKILTSSGISIIEAAHILPFSHFKNDNKRNGIALCKNHHWLFDRGFISVDPHYRVLVANTIEREYPKKVITGYRKKEIILPSEPSIYPSQIALGWHRKNVLQK